MTGGVPMGLWFNANLPISSEQMGCTSCLEAEQLAQRIAKILNNKHSPSQAPPQVGPEHEEGSGSAPPAASPPSTCEGPFIESFLLQDFSFAH